MRRPILLSILLLATAGCALLPPREGPPPREIARLPLPNCTLAMDDPQYWSNKYLFQDQLLLTPEQIAALNRQNVSRGLLTDVGSGELWQAQTWESAWGDFNQAEDLGDNPNPQQRGLQGYTLYTYLKDETERLKRRPRWDPEGRPVPAERFTELDRNLNLFGLRETNPARHGLTRRRTDVRYYPTDQVINGQRWESEFDILQVSAIQAFQPLAILHTSLDGEWVFVVTAYCRGWVKRRDVVEGCAPEALAAFGQPKQFVVVTDHAVDAVAAPGNTQVAERFYLGTVCPLLEKTETQYVLAVPGAVVNGRPEVARVYLPRSADVSEGFLPCTPRTLWQISFKLLHQPYSWGGRGEDRDCSQFLLDVFATMGLKLPRNSSAQAMVGTQRVNLALKTPADERRSQLDRLNQPALLQFPGHIMLYLGRDSGRHYVIHDIWSFRRGRPSGEDRKVVIGQVVVSDLSLGEDSSKKSLLERVTVINLLQP
jgi:hypothetical protein